MKKIKITKKEARRYFLIFLFISMIVLVALSIDNILWINKSPEWNTEHTVCNNLKCWTGSVIDYNFSQKMNYVIGYRIYTVWSNWRDISSALFIGTLFSLTVIVFNEIIGKRVFHRSFIK